MNDSTLKAAGITIRERKVPDRRNKDLFRLEYQVVDGRKIVSCHVMLADARKAAEGLLAAECK